MITLPDTTTEAGQKEASVMLARLIGWNWTQVGVDVLIEPPEYRRDPYGVRIRSFYHPSCMQYAWRVLNWAATQTVTVKAQKGGGDDIWQEPWTTFIDDEINGKYELYRMPSADAQRAWLDKILSLAIEAGMVKE